MYVLGFFCPLTNRYLGVSGANWQPSNNDANPLNDSR